MLCAECFVLNALCFQVRVDELLREHVANGAAASAPWLSTLGDMPPQRAAVSADLPQGAQGMNPQSREAEGQTSVVSTLKTLLCKAPKPYTMKLCQIL